MKKYIRYIVSIVLGVISYPLLVCVYSVCCIVFFMAMFYIPLYFVYWLGSNEKGIDECKDAFEMFIMPFVVPFQVWYSYATTGKF